MKWTYKLNEEIPFTTVEKIFTILHKIPVSMYAKLISFQMLHSEIIIGKRQVKSGIKTYSSRVLLEKNGDISKRFYCVSYVYFNMIYGRRVAEQKQQHQFVKIREIKRYVVKQHTAVYWSKRYFPPSRSYTEIENIV